MEKKQIEAKIVERKASKTSDEEVFEGILDFLSHRKEKTLMHQKILLEFDKDREGQEKFWIRDIVFDPDINKLDAMVFENTNEIYPAKLDENGNIIGGKIFDEENFDMLLKELFCERGVFVYTTKGKGELLRYAKTKIGTSRGKPVFPTVELNFLKSKNFAHTKVLVTAKENRFISMKNVDFSGINKVCKEINRLNNLKAMQKIEELKR